MGTVGSGRENSGQFSYSIDRRIFAVQFVTEKLNYYTKVDVGCGPVESAVDPSAARMISNSPISKLIVSNSLKSTREGSNPLKK